ncbi:SRPBCC domain-containing protein [Rhodococcus sp. H29-C3]|uniref:SRPBCC domain-containing protein n=1 Tax=Rhodococcus sp. H29-C3 TaxID=3046307 RepID=UPI0024BB0F00|nr:SRPBCC domain-containing protein [Rhodococcus sp. H29-C3]MDJ0363452.1 SRPBCC domain-containing protein [Rhodococcus sp. H29-C3]
MNTLHEVDVEADTEVPIIRIRREFSATPAQLMTAHTDPTLFARWVGPDNMKIEILEWDARNGGCWRYTARGDDEYRFRGCFHTIAEHEIVQTFTFEGLPDDVSLQTLRFEDLGEGRTRLHVQSLVDSFSGRDAWLASGMKTGLTQGYAKLDKILGEL